MKQISIETALEFINNKFHEFASILNIDTDTILDIIVKDLSSNRYYEVYSDEDWTNLKMIKINF